MVNWKATETMFVEFIELYAKNWAKIDQVELRYLSEWKDQLNERPVMSPHQATKYHKRWIGEVLQH